MEIVGACVLCMEVTLLKGHFLVTLFFYLTNFLKVLIFLIMLRLYLFALNMEIMLQSGFIFVHHSDEAFETS